MTSSQTLRTNCRTVGDLLAAFLEAAGARTAFGVLSVHNMPLLDALARRDALRYVCARGEAGAVLPVRFREELDRLLVLAADRGRSDDPLIRQRLAWCYSKVEIMRYLGLRTLTSFLAGRSPGNDAAITKLYWSEYHKVVMALALDILGPDATVPSGRWPSNSISTDDYGAPAESASWVGTFYASVGGTIYAGASQVQRNIIGERILGLPKEPNPR